MVSFAHRQLLDRLVQANAVPKDNDAFLTWITGAAHLRLLQEDVDEDELIVAAMPATSSCLNTLVVHADDPRLKDLEALLEWSPNPYHFSAAEYNWTWSGDRAWVEPNTGGWASNVPEDASTLVFGVGLDGTDDESASYLELSQTFAHQVGIHWRSERTAHSRIDHRGDWDDIVSVTNKNASQHIGLVSFQRQTLDLHLVALSSVLVRSFEFTLYRPPFDLHVHDRPSAERLVRRSDYLLYRETTKSGHYCHIRGVQIIRPALSAAEAHYLARHGHISPRAEEKPVDFIVQDIRNRRNVTVSTDHATTTTYFDALSNDLPYETSPAFFRADVLSKYKADRDKYTVYDNHFTCRGGWGLKKYSINDAGQVAVYICDLRDLPREEQVYWAIFNELPRAGLSKSAITTDFLGEWPDEPTPLEAVIEVLERWRTKNLVWWSWVAEGEPSHLTVPRMGNRDEWAEAFLTLSQAVIEGFRVKALRSSLENIGALFEQDNQSIKLLERLLHSKGKLEVEEKLEALREINDVRVQAKAHATGGKGREIAKDAQANHGSYAAHYEHVCRKLAEELALIEETLEPR